MAKYILSAFADEYDESFIEQLKALNRFNIDYIEIRGVNGKNVSTLSREEVLNAKKLLKEFNVKVNSIGSPLGKIKLSGDIKEHFKVAKKVFETANELGAKHIRAFSFYPPDGKEISSYRDDVISNLDKMADLASSYGVTLCHENEADIYGESAESCLDIITSLNGKIKAVFDMGNFTLFKYDPISAYNTLKPHIEYFHIKDALKAGAIVPPGKGEAKIEEILRDYIKTAKEDVFITLEPHLQTFSGLNALTGFKFDNPYKYQTQREAFTDAVVKIKEILSRI